MATPNPIEVISKCCSALSNNNLDLASQIVKKEYPHKPYTPGSRSYTPDAMTTVFVRDGFIDRYTGKRLIFPPALRLLSMIIPDELPYQLHGKMDVCHIAHWELTGTIDHVEPITRGGKHEISNWVTTSMLQNSVKSNWTLDELGWTLHSPGSYEDWDGLLSWFCDYVDQHPEHNSVAFVKRWRNAASRVLAVCG